MMRRLFALLIVTFMIATCVSCGTKDAVDTASQQNSASTGDEFEFDDSVDYIDLTTMNSTMVYAQVLNIVQNPEQYIGKTLKMSGTFGVFYDDVMESNYYACLIADATACCSQGIEFILGDGAAYPEDYPEQDSEIVVEGEITTYEIEGYVIPTLKDARLL